MFEIIIYLCDIIWFLQFFYYFILKNIRISVYYFILKICVFIFAGYNLMTFIPFFNSFFCRFFNYAKFYWGG